MKNRSFYCSLLLLLLMLFTSAFPEATHAQDCNSSFYQMKEGASFTLTSYNPKNKPLSSVKNTYSIVKSSDTGLTAQIEQNAFDANDQLIDNDIYEISCQNGLIRLNLQDLMGPEVNLQDAKAKVELSGDAMEIPSNLQVGQHLKDATMHLTAIQADGLVLDQHMKIKYRKVDGRETVVTPAGKFDTFKISYMIELTGKMKKPWTMKTVAWFAVGPGMVKTESYNSKGKLTGYTILTDFSE